MRSILRAWIVGSILLTPSVASAQSGWFLENHGYCDTVLAEPRGAQTTVLFPAWADSFPFAVNDRSSLVWDISVGSSIPFMGFRSRAGTDSPTGVPAGAFGVGLWFPLSFHMIEDMGKDPSNPILNTDYRFGGQVKMQYGLPDDRGWSSAHLGMKFQFGHESTHIGDEFTLGALRTHPNEFLRVNVSYEYWDLAGSFEPNFGQDGRHQLKFRAGNIWLWRPRDGWYSPELLQPYGQFVARSSRNHEPYLQFEWFREPDGTGWLKRLGIITSLDVRNRTIYQYTIVPDDSHVNPPEPTQWSANLVAGLRQVRSGAGEFGKITPTYFLRWYHGVNPNGQFRSQANFSEIGFGVHFGF